MRRFAVISDIHANLPALRATLDSIASARVDGILCCGDIVGYGASPNECCGLLRALEVPVVLGNHDQAAIHTEETAFFNEVARVAALWTARNLSPENAEYLAGLPLRIAVDEHTMVHSSPRDPSAWDYVLTRGEAFGNFPHFSGTMCLIGHSHQPTVIELRGRDLLCHPAGEVEMTPGSRFLVNVGSVGQPRDYDPRACYAEVDLDRGAVRHHRVEYPVEESQQAIIDAGLPREIAMRLAVGV